MFSLKILKEEHMDAKQIQDVIKKLDNNKNNERNDIILHEVNSLI